MNANECSPKILERRQELGTMFISKFHILYTHIAHISYMSHAQEHGHRSYRCSRNLSRYDHPRDCDYDDRTDRDETVLAS